MIRAPPPVEQRALTLEELEQVLDERREVQLVRRHARERLDVQPDDLLQDVAGCQPRYVTACTCAQRHAKVGTGVPRRVTVCSAPCGAPPRRRW